MGPKWPMGCQAVTSGPMPPSQFPDADSGDWRGVKLAEPRGRAPWTALLHLSKMQRDGPSSASRGIRSQRSRLPSQAPRSSWEWGEGLWGRGEAGAGLTHAPLPPSSLMSGHSSLGTPCGSGTRLPAPAASSHQNSTWQGFLGTSKAENCPGMTSGRRLTGVSSGEGRREIKVEPALNRWRG